MEIFPKLGIVGGAITVAGDDIPVAGEAVSIAGGNPPCG